MTCPRPARPPIPLTAPAPGPAEPGMPHILLPLAVRLPRRPRLTWDGSPTTPCALAVARIIACNSRTQPKRTQGRVSSEGSKHHSAAPHAARLSPAHSESQSCGARLAGAQYHRPGGNIALGSVGHAPAKKRQLSRRCRPSRPLGRLPHHRRGMTRSRPHHSHQPYSQKPLANILTTRLMGPHASPSNSAAPKF